MDGFSSSKFTGALDPEAYAIGAVGAGPEIDTRGYRHAVFVLNIGDCAGTYTFQVEDCATSGGVFADVTGATASVIITSGDSTMVVAVDLDKTNRYLQVKAGTVGTGAIDLSASCVLTNGPNTANYATVPTASV